MTTIKTNEVTFPKVVLAPVYFKGNGNMVFQNVAEKHRAVINPDTNELYAIASNKYRLLPHEECLEITDTFLKKNDFGVVKKHVSLFENGKMKTTYTFEDLHQDVKTSKKNKGDVINPMFTVRNAYDLTWTYNLEFSGYRVVCSNGLVMPVSLFQYKHKHYNSLTEDSITHMIMKGLNSFQDQIETWNKWQTIATSPYQYESIMTGMEFGKKELNGIQEEIEVSSNLRLDDIKVKSLSYWMFFNILMQYITHQIAIETRRVTLSERAASLFYKR